MNPLRRLIRTKLLEHFLDNYSSTMDWVKINHTDWPEDEDQSMEADWSRETAEDRASEYSYRYNQIISQPVVTLYRAIKVNSLDGIEWSRVGKHWSFEEDGVGIYGQVPSGHKEGKTLVLTGQVSPQDIDWEYGFQSFLYYGEEQWEAALNPNVPVRIVAIDGRPVDIKANSGSGYGLGWEG